MRCSRRQKILAERCDHQPFIAKAPLVLVFTADFQIWRTLFDAEGIKTDPVFEANLFLAMQDCIIAAQNAVVAAQSLGIGSCYIGDILENYEANWELLHLPKYSVPCVMLVMGHLTEQQKARRKPARLSIGDIVSVDTYPKPDADSAGDGLRCLMEKEVEDAPEGRRILNRGTVEITDSAVDARILDTANRKFRSDFHREMQRSVKKILESWCE